jgi:3-hydroxyisobutyrate dehydrogenase-like beta-hydroxyacid dehydrogenase
LTVEPAPQIGVVGLGAMGGRVAALLRRRGHALAVYDPRGEALEPLAALGAEVCASAAEVADRAATVLLSLPTPEVVRLVATGPDGISGGSEIRTCIDLSTTGPSVAREVCRELDAAGITLVDAPVSGGIAGAQDGTLTVMAACRAQTFEAVLPLLEEIAGGVFHVGLEPGMGQLAKVLNNLLSATALAATAEAVALGVKEGLDAQMLLDVLNASSGRNSATAQKFPRSVLPRTFDFGFALALMNKDVQIWLAEARRSRVPMRVGEAVAGVWADAEALAHDGADCTEIVRLIESRAGTTIAASGIDAT